MTQGFAPQYSRADIVRRGLDAGLTQVQLSAVLGISTQAVSQWIRNHETELSHHQPCDGRSTCGAVASLLLRAGVPICDVARALGVTPSAIGNIRRRAGIESRYTSDHKEMIRDLRSGMSARDVAAKHGKAESSVYTLAYLYGERLSTEQRAARRARKPI